MEALVDIRAARRFANRVQVQAAESGLEVVEGFEMCALLPRPFRKPGPDGGSELDQGIVHGFLMMGLNPAFSSLPFASANCFRSV